MDERPLLPAVKSTLNCVRLTQLLLTGVSDNVGGVKRFLRILSHALKEERHFALIE